ncbi:MULTISPECIES: cupin domain-containing protein [Halorussus]|uniref:cupin domain-containing protein n=1 Tax=Halorussus TaxID=1070314 RepID=UPI000E20E0D6|nr:MULTISPECIES: cupin domain-containing protein [Halorussus]NHN61270.1 cupin domain-containing protein [Halorussus sp. JP-T4]
MYEKTGLADLETRDVEGVEPGLKAVGYELRPEEMRPSIWEFAAGESNNRHRQREQEELYYVLDGEFRVTVEDDDGTSESFELGADEVVVIPPETWRQFEAETDGRLLVVGAPNAEDDAVTEDDADDGDGAS